ncbi:MAG: TlpA family protein disulfide reductase [Oceanospirillaceae bacterium]|nr:TlpA family protein disulfide reductase [Oceanospirillaceae bacterium]
MRGLVAALVTGITLALAPLTSQAQAPESVYELAFTDLQQKPAALDTYRGKVLLLNFWATWCPPCVREMPSMERLQQRFPAGELAVVAVNVGENKDTIDRFLQRLESPLGFRILLDESGSAFTELGIPGLPMTFLYNRHGNLVESHAGGDDWDSDARVEQIEALLEQP